MILASSAPPRQTGDGDGFPSERREDEGPAGGELLPRPLPAAWFQPDPYADETSPGAVVAAAKRYVAAGLSVTRNGSPQRKQLSDQLDRLDGIIDTLADGLSEAVSDAVKKGTATALQQILLEAVNNPATRELLRQTFAPEASKAATVVAGPVTDASTIRKASFLARCKGIVVKAARKVAAWPRKVVAGTKTLARKVAVRTRMLARKAKVLTRRLNVAWQLKKAVVVGLGIGAVVTAVSLWSHPLASMLSGIGATATAFAVHVGLWCRNTAKQLVG